MWLHPERPHQDLPPLPPARPVESVAVLKATVSAGRALARLDGACKRLPDPTMLINLIPLLEAQASTEIENIVTTHDEVFRAAHYDSPGTTPQAKEALRYREALHHGFDSLRVRPVTTRTALDVCTRLQGKPARIRNTPGTYIGGSRSGTRVYTPPEGETVIRDHLGAWERFIHASHGLDPLVVMALAHYQFEAIHPFYDGNGRTGRVLNLLLLVEQGLLELPVLYLSGHILRHKDEYHRLLNDVTRQDAWEEWLLFMLAAVESTADWTLGLIDTTDELRQRFSTSIRATHPRLPAADLTELLFRQPYLRIEKVVESGLAQRQTAAKWLTELADSGLVVKEKVGRGVVFINKELLDTLFETPLPE